MLKSDESMDEKLYNELLEKENMGEYRKMLVGLPSQTADNLYLQIWFLKLLLLCSSVWLI